MVGLVIVSHSLQLAQGVRQLIAQMSQGQVPVAIAAGIDDPEDPLGTDAMRVLEAIQEVYSDDGVLILTDLGSALLSAETAIEFLSPEQQAHIRLSQAPLVEGAVAAAVQSAAGLDLEAVEAEARQGMAGKIAHLAAAGEGTAPTEALATITPKTLPGKTITLTIHNRFGLHARPAARFVISKQPLKDLKDGTVGFIIDVAESGGQFTEKVKNKFGFGQANKKPSDE